MLATACWFDPMPPGHVKIGISRGTPRGMEHIAKVPALFPGSWFRTAETEEYRARYAQQLASLDPAEIVAEIEAKAQRQIAVLCCYERLGSGDWCHRGYVSAWLCLHLGLVVPELHDASGAYAGSHPMLPAEFRRPSACKPSTHEQHTLL